jgi:UDP-N-acetylmuramoyl-L-alanyl-D-glutamate--2,6-diaminopimelate ligase
MRAENLIPSRGVRQVSGSTDVKIERLVIDSRKAVENSLFAAIKGLRTDGHRFVRQALENGAVAIICEEFPSELKTGICYIQVEDSRQGLAEVAKKFFDNPSKKLRLVGVTGTNGKTTVASILHQLFTKLGFRAGLISTVVNKVGSRDLPSSYTTPDIVAVNELLDSMVAEGCDYAFMEVSSHAIDQKRVEGLEYSLAIFTNLSHDHLDYHQDFDRYLATKKRMFDQLPKASGALINLDDRNAKIMVQNTSARVSTYAMWKLADYKVKVRSNDLYGLELELDGVEMHSRLIGEFNALNLCAAYGAALILEQDKLEVLKALSDVEPVAGRMDYIMGNIKRVVGIVDYAHTPDALQKVLESIQGFRIRPGRIIVVVGCGGDRDKRKRPEMAKIAVMQSDMAVFTTDNPRSEDPEAILDDMLAGVDPVHRSKYTRISNREEAIVVACQLSRDGDIILVAGKGHENYQEVKGKRTILTIKRF